MAVRTEVETGRAGTALPVTAAAMAAAAGVPCVIWTVNAPRALDRYLGHAAVEGVITDLPALALQRRSRLDP